MISFDVTARSRISTVGAAFSSHNFGKTVRKVLPKTSKKLFISAETKTRSGFIQVDGNSKELPNDAEKASYNFGACADVAVF